MLDGTMTARGKSQAQTEDRRAGFSMVVILVIFFFLSIVGSSLCSILSVTHTSGLSRFNSARAFYIAQSGLHWALRNRTASQGNIPFGGGTFSLVEKNKWRFEIQGTFGDTIRRTRGYRSMEYFPGTRDQSSSPEDIDFYVQNQTGYWIDFNGFKIEWSGPTAYYAKVLMTEDGDTDLTTVWDKSSNGGKRAASDEKISLWSKRWMAPGETIQIVLEDFESSKYGGSDVDMSAVPLKLYFYDYSYNYQFTVVGIE